MQKKGILLIQLGTPEKLTLSGVRKYLREFLSDKRVINLPLPIRYLLVYGIILPIRAKKSLKAYEAIWTPLGSPLRIYSDRLLKKLQAKLEKTHVVKLGMRYGSPSLLDALHELKSFDDITVLPLYPQFAASTSTSSIEVVMNYFSAQNTLPNLRIIRDFYAHPAFIKAQAAQIKPYIEKPFDHMIFSYHGLPESHITESGCKTICEHACPNPEDKNSVCYRAQCFQTSRLLADALGLHQNDYTTSFQSRLGKTPWIKPYTDEQLSVFAQKGFKNLLIACPAFVADCLETIEEIGMQAKEAWLMQGGKTLTLIPCLNDEPHWVDALESIILQK